MSRRSRVVGPGPARELLPNFKIIYEISEFDLLQKDVLKIVDQCKEENDLYSESYDISKNCDLRPLIPSEHRNLLLQSQDPMKEAKLEMEYTLWTERSKNSLVKNLLLDLFPNCYRSRIAILPPEQGINWHIDMNTRVSCRVHIPITHPNFLFEFNRKGDLEKADLRLGYIYFTNTAYPHRVFNNTGFPRVSVLCDMPYSDLERYLPLNT